MPTFTVTAPDGSSYTLTGPEGSTEQDALRIVQAQHAPQPTKTASQAATGAEAAALPITPVVTPQEIEAKRTVVSPTGSFLDNINAGFGGALNRAGLAVKQAGNAVAEGIHAVLPEGVNAALDSANQALGLPTADQARDATNAAIAEHARLDAPLQATAGGKVGEFLGSAAASAPLLVLPGASTLAGAAAYNAAAGAALTPGDVQERGLAAAGGAAGGAAGNLAGKAIAGALAKRLAAADAAGTTAAAQNATRDATLVASQDAGYVVPPSAVNPGLVANLTEGLGGKLKVAQSASIKNQAVTNDLARDALGLPKDSPLNSAALDAIRNQAGQAYEAVKQTGQVVADPTYTSAIQKLATGKLAQDFPELANGEVSSLSKALDKPDFSAESAIELLKQLRFDGFANKGLQDPGKKALGKAQLTAADAVEGLLDRNLTAQGQGDLLDNFVVARQLIAMTHSVEKALNPDTGNVIASKLAGQMAKGKPLSGDLAQIGQFASAFKDAAKEGAGAVPIFSPLDGFAAGAGGLPGVVAALARPGLRALALSPLVQKTLIPEYGPGFVGRQVTQIANNPAAQLSFQQALASGGADLEQEEPPKPSLLESYRSSLKR